MRWADEASIPPRPVPTLPDPGIYECCGGRAAYGHNRRRHMWNRVFAAFLFAGLLTVVGVVIYMGASR